MQVMIVGGNQMKYVASRYYDYANKLANGFIRNNHTVIRFFDRDIARMSNIFRTRKLGVSGANKKLLQQASSFQPSLILFIHADVIRVETLERLKEILPAAKLAQISIDPFHQRVTIGERSFGHQIVNIRSPVLNGRITAPGPSFDNDLNHG